MSTDLHDLMASYLLGDAHIALGEMGQNRTAIEVVASQIKIDIGQANWSGVRVVLTNLSISLMGLSRLAQSNRCRSAALAVAMLKCDPGHQFRAQLGMIIFAVQTGRLAEAQELWNWLDQMGRNWRREIYRQGTAEYWFAELHYRHGQLTEDEINHAERLCRQGHSRYQLREVLRLRGRWCLDREKWLEGVGSFAEALRLAREVGPEDWEARAGLALARFHLGEVNTAREEAEDICMQPQGPDKRHKLPLAELWLALDERERAKEHALAAYRWAWADGEPYVFRLELDRAKALLKKLCVEPPVLPPYDPAKDGKYPMEDEVNAAIERLRAEKASEKEAKEAQEDGAANE